MAIEQVISGPFESSWDGLEMGFTRRGFEFQFMNHAEPVNETDAYGRSLLDAIHQGGDVMILAIFRIWKDEVVQAMNPFSKTNNVLGELDSDETPIGIRYSDFASGLILTAVANTPAAASFPLTVSADAAILAPNSTISVVLGPTAREIPMRIALLPFGEASGPNTWFLMT